MVTVYSIIFIIYTAYYLFIGAAVWQWTKLPHSTLSPFVTKETSISIVVPFRNEKGVLTKLAEQLMFQLIELENRTHNIKIILVDDHSTDGTSTEVEKSVGRHEDFTLLHSLKEGKKEALKLGIAHSTAEWIITLDADIELPKQWLFHIKNELAQSKADLLILPVGMKRLKNTLQRLAALDFYAMQGLTFGYASLGRPFLANGAHLAFKKEAFLSVNGYEEHLDKASGDDVMLMESLRKSTAHKVDCLFHSALVVNTTAASSFKEFIHQRVRWGSKTSASKLVESKMAGLLILLANLTVVVFLCLGSYFPMFLALVIKSLADALLLMPVIKSYKRENLGKYIPLLILIYPFYIIFVSVATLILKPTWKGRKV